MSSRETSSEIEITPEMIAAGMREYGSRWLGLRAADDDVAKEMLTAAFRVMFLSRPKSRQPNRQDD